MFHGRLGPNVGHGQEQGQRQGQDGGREHHHETVGCHPAETLTYQSELVSPITDESGVSAGSDEPRGQGMAADDDQDMEWLEYEEQVQIPRSEEESVITSSQS